MPILGNNKSVLLSQIDKAPTIEVAQLQKLLGTYDDLQLSDLKGHVSDLIYEQLLDAQRDPNERTLWGRIESMPHTSPEEIQNLQRLVSSYIQQYPSGPKINEANTRMNSLQGELNVAYLAKQKEQELRREQNDWEHLERGNYSALQSYRMKYPQSVHLDEIDDCMWNNTKAVINFHSLSRYLSDWPTGRHAAEANNALASIGEWEEIKHSNDIFKVDDYRDNHADSPFKNEVNALYYQLRDQELNKMKANPSEFSKDYVEKLVNADIFTQWQLQDEGLVTERSWETLQLDRDIFPNIQDYQLEDPHISAANGCTDIYLFGTPGTGKTCLLMGLAGSNGKGYSLNMKAAGGPYASALQQYLNAGITPGRTFGKFVTTINGQVIEERKRDTPLYHNINLVEMSGEEFALRIADGKDVSLANMGTGATNLLRNMNRKAFFIIVDPTKDMVKVEYLEQVKDAAGNVIDERIRKKYISQLDILNKFVGLFDMDENKDIMSRVDAIHFVVTKADFLGSPSERINKAKELLQNKYSGPVQALKLLCAKTKRINYSTDYRPHVFTFSLGKFFLGDVFDFEPLETDQIVNAIRTITGSEKEKSWFDKLMESLQH